MSGLSGTPPYLSGLAIVLAIEETGGSKPYMSLSLRLRVGRQGHGNIVQTSASLLNRSQSSFERR
jgi:hypothetical protein